MTLFLYQIDRNEQEDFIEITRYFVDENQKTIKKTNKIQYQVYLRKEDIRLLELKKEEFQISGNTFHNKEEEEVMSLSFNNRTSYKNALQTIKEEKGVVYELDLPFEHRFLIENPTKNTFLPLKFLSIDIETIILDENINIVSLSTHSPSSVKENIVYINTEYLSEEVEQKINTKTNSNFKIIKTKNEKELLEKFQEQMFSFKPQLILGWNVIDFDFKIIKERMDHYKINFSFSTYEEEFKLRINSDFFKDSTLTGPGILFFDVISLLRTNFIAFEDYKLNTVAKKVLGEEKIELDKESNPDNKIEQIKKMYFENPNRLIEYNFKDSLLTSEIVNKLKLIELMQQRSIITKTPLSKVKSPIASLDIMYLEELHAINYVADSNFSFSDTSPIEGAYVLTPHRGFYENVFVFDFKSLYPSIIMTFNIDPFTYSKKGEIEAPNEAKFTKKEGILPKIIKGLYLERDIAKKENNKTKSFAIKTTMNSFYGAVASPKCRFYNKNVGEAITSFGRDIIQKAKKFVEEEGHQAIYGDTDSIFVKLKNNEKENPVDNKKIGIKFENKLNQYFEAWIKKEFKQKNYLNIELEKIFSHFFIASKKRYVGYDEMSKKTIFVGMEAVRGDWTVLAKNFQKELIKLIFSKKTKTEIEKFILKYVIDLNSGKYDDLLVYKKKITKDLSKYTKTTPPHVKAAREIENFKGRTVYYVMTKDGPKHISLVYKDTKLDYEHYINKQLAGVSDDILESVGIDFKDLLYKRKQKGLEEFF